MEKKRKKNSEGDTFITLDLLKKHPEKAWQILNCRYLLILKNALVTRLVHIVHHLVLKTSKTPICGSSWDLLSLSLFHFFPAKMEDASLIAGVIAEPRAALGADSWPFSPQTVEEQLCFCLLCLCSPWHSCPPHTSAAIP